MLLSEPMSTRGYHSSPVYCNHSAHKPLLLIRVAYDLGSYHVSIPVTTGQLPTPHISSQLQAPCSRLRSPPQLGRAVSACSTDTQVQDTIWHITEQDAPVKVRAASSNIVILNHAVSLDRSR